MFINGMHFPIVTVLKYLGIYITSELGRRTTVAKRIQAAYRAFYMLEPFLSQHKLPWNLLLQIYHSLITPTALYGLKVATMVERNRNSLRRMEENIVRQLVKLARDPPSTTNITELLRGRTIIITTCVRRLKYWGHIMRRPATHALRRAMGYRIRGKKKIGRPCFTWKNSLQYDLARTGMNNWEESIMDKTLHETKCNSLYQLMKDTP